MIAGPFFVQCTRRVTALTQIRRGSIEIGVVVNVVAVDIRPAVMTTRLRPNAAERCLNASWALSSDLLPLAS